MKKTIFVPMILGLVFIISCAGKKDRLTSDTMMMTIEPPQVSVLPNTKTTLNIVTYNSSGVSNVGISPTWSTTNSSVGTLTPSQGKTVIFNSVALGTTTVYAQYGSARATGNIAVVSVLPKKNVPLAEFDVFREIPMLSNAGKFLLGTPNPPTKYGGGLYKWWSNTVVNLSTVKGIVGVDHTEGSQGLRVDISSTPLGGGGIWFQFGDNSTVNPPTPVATDLSQYASGNLVFDVKSTQDLEFRIEDYQGYGPNGQISQFGWVNDGNWHTITITRKINDPYWSLYADFTKTAYPFYLGVEFYSGPALTYYVDNVRWEVN